MQINNQLERFVINLTINVKDIMDFDRKFIEFLNNNSEDWEYETKQIISEEERKETVNTIRELINKNDILYE